MCNCYGPAPPARRRPNADRDQHGRHADVHRDGGRAHGDEYARRRYGDPHLRAAGRLVGRRPGLPTVLVRAVGVYFPANGKFYSVGGRTADTAGSDFQHVLEYTPGNRSWVQKGVTLPDNP